mmetsp:Transcript_14962/g.18506  ORF Transcript_14962/g.18506 Transcript_14962/m.18506 type:complete len:94 (+) Transcript_14962:1278-1559(+)
MHSWLGDRREKGYVSLLQRKSRREEDLGEKPLGFVSHVVAILRHRSIFGGLESDSIGWFPTVHVFLRFYYARIGYNRVDICNSINHETGVAYT